MRTRALRTILYTLPLLVFWANSGATYDEATVSIIQYNVKGGQGGWTGGTLDAQVRLIANEIEDSVVDFVALEQASQPGTLGPLISDKLAEIGLVGWNTVVSLCNKDATQLGFSSNWEFVPGTHNPLLNSASPQRGWIAGGCERHGNGRPYNVAYFRNKNNQFKLLVVIMHMPHCPGGNPTCISSWNREQFVEDVRAVLGTDDRANTDLIAVGDMNELGGVGDPNAFAPLFPDFGTLKISNGLPTCCSDSDWTYSFDRILTNSRNTPSAGILYDGMYPLNPAFRGHGEEHKAIFGKIMF
jgi:hypothetical protein